MVLGGFPLLGMAVEVFGFINLFGDFFPVALGFMKRLPFVGNVMALPGIKGVVDRIAEAGKLPV